MSWAQQRKATYMLSFLSILIVTFLIIAYVFFNKAPTCFDGIKNQGEAGIDCGGPCSILCKAGYVNPKILWTAKSKVLASGTYNILVYAENPNIDAGVYSAGYSLKLYDQSGNLLSEKLGTTYIPPNNRFAIFVDGINIYDKVPARIDFSFADSLVWQKIADNESGINTFSKDLQNVDTKPKFLVTVQNTTLNQFKNIEAIAILYDKNNNAVAFSKTKLDVLDKNSTADIVFTWPEAFSNPIITEDVVYKVLPN